jgi:RHS repeat-associated protein
MKNHTILTALAVLAVALAHPAMAEFTHTKGEVTHLNGVALPPITTAAQARAETEKRLAAIKAEEAKAAKVSASSPSAISNPQLFYTGKPYLEETGQYVFLFRHYDPELGRWTTSDPSGFPDGANNVGYVNNQPTVALDALALAIVRVDGSYFAIRAWTERLYPDFSIGYPPSVSFEWREEPGSITSRGGTTFAAYVLPAGAVWVSGEIPDDTLDTGNVYGSYWNIPYTTRSGTRTVTQDWHAFYRTE